MTRPDSKVPYQSDANALGDRRYFDLSGVWTWTNETALESQIHQLPSMSDPCADLRTDLPTSLCCGSWPSVELLYGSRTVSQTTRTRPRQRTHGCLTPSTTSTTTNQVAWGGTRAPSSSSPAMPSAFCLQYHVSTQDRFVFTSSGTRSAFPCLWVTCAWP